MGLKELEDAYKKVVARVGSHRSKADMAFKLLGEAVVKGDIDETKRLRDEVKAWYNRYTVAMAQLPIAISAYERWEDPVEVTGPAGKQAHEFDAMVEAVHDLGDGLEGFPTDEEFDPTKLKVVDAHPGGTTGAKVVEIGGRKFMLKQVQPGKKITPEHIRNEVAYNRAYRAAGIEAKAGRVYEKEGKVYSVMEYIEGLIPLHDYMARASSEDKEKMRKELAKGFVLDALFANWDVLGTNQDNVMVSKDGKRVVRIDNGSCGKWRAMGDPKGDTEWKNRETIDELWSLRTSSINGGVYDKLQTVDIIEGAAKHMKDIEAAVATLPVDDQKAISKPLAELKDLCERVPRVIDAGYTRDTAGLMVDGSHQLHRIKFKNECPKSVSRENYGTCRSSGRTSNVPPKPQPPSTTWDGTEFSQKITKAAISINHHIITGDFSPNTSSVEEAIKQKSVLEGMAKYSDDAKKLLKFVKNIEESKANGFKDKIGMVPSVNIPEDPSVAKAKQEKYQKELDEWNKITASTPVAKHKSVTDAAWDAIMAGGGDPHLISEWQSSQARHSWGTEACKVKYLEMLLRGETMASAKVSGMYQGTTSSGIYKAEKFYKDNPDILEKDKRTLAAWKAAVVMFLESTDVPGRNEKERTLFAVRTENYSSVIRAYDIKDEVPCEYPIAPCESFGCGKVVSVHGSERVAVKVPYERVMGLYFWERTPGSDMCAYYGDSEQEVNIDCYNNPYPRVYIASSLSFDGYRAKYESILKEWENKGKKRIKKGY